MCFQVVLMAQDQMLQGGQKPLSTPTQQISGSLSGTQRFICRNESFPSKSPLPYLHACIFLPFCFPLQRYSGINYLEEQEHTVSTSEIQDGTQYVIYQAWLRPAADAKWEGTCTKCFLITKLVINCSLKYILCFFLSVYMKCTFITCQKLQHYGLNVTGTEVRKPELMSPQQL